MASHTATGEWKSFEIRMRRRRAEHLALRAEAAANAGLLDEARQALSEARRLAPDVPQVAQAERSILAIQDAGSVKQQERPRDASRYVAIAALVFAAGVGIVWIADHTSAMPWPAARSSPLPAAHPETPAPDPSQTPARPVTVEQQPITVAERLLGIPAPAPAPAPAVIEAERLPRPASSPEPPPANSAVVPSTQHADETEITPTRTAPPMPAADVVMPRPSMPAAVSALPVVSAPSVTKAAVESSAPADDVLVQRTLDRYATAYSRLDADAAQQVWPSVNRGALEKAFGELALQQVSLRNCRIDIEGEAARAACAGSETWAPKIGDRAPRTQARNWTFELAKAGAEWQIVSARVQNK